MGTLDMNNDGKVSKVVKRRRNSREAQVVKMTEWLHESLVGYLEGQRMIDVGSDHHAQSLH